MNSVVIKSIDRSKINQAVYDYVNRLRAEHPEVERAIWFGSWVTGLPMPGSDVDICLIVAKSDKKPRDRIPDYLPLGFPVGIDLFVYTNQEFKKLKTVSPGWYAAITSGVEV